MDALPVRAPVVVVQWQSNECVSHLPLMAGRSETHYREKNNQFETSAYHIHTQSCFRQSKDPPCQNHWQ